MPDPTETALLAEVSESQKRQYIDAETVFRAYTDAKQAAAGVRGSMIWRELRGKKTLIRTSAAGGQKSLGVESAETTAMYARFNARKISVEERLTSLKGQMTLQQRLNRAQRVGRVPNVVVAVLQALEKAAVEKHFLVVGTHALHAYEAAAGVRIGEPAMATRDIDLLFSTRKRVSFVTALEKLDSSLIGVLRKADPSFEIVADQHYTARNRDGFEVDIIRRAAAPDAGARDPHPLRMGANEDDFWAVQVAMGERLLGARRFDQMVVATSGQMALIRTIHPLDFSRIKRDLADQVFREPLKKGKDRLQARVVDDLVRAYLPHLM